MGTPEFAVPALTSLVAAGHDIAAVYCQPPRPAGRGKSPRKSPVHRAAEAAGLPVLTPENFKPADVRDQFAALGLDLAVVVAYGLILPPAVLDAPKYGCVNLHASLLPRWRGAAPIQRAIIAGDRETGITAMTMTAGLDSGPMLVRRAVAIAPGETGGSLHDRLSALAGEMVGGVVDGVLAGQLDASPQPDDGVVYAAKIDKREARIIWARPAVDVDRTIRALSPAPGAWFPLGEGRLKVLMCRAVPGDGPPGTVLDGEMTIACAAGAVQLLRVQPAGGKPMMAGDFLRGHDLRPGTVLA